MALRACGSRDQCPRGSVRVQVRPDVQRGTREVCGNPGTIGGSEKCGRQPESNQTRTAQRRVFIFVRETGSKKTVVL